MVEDGKRIFNEEKKTIFDEKNTVKYVVFAVSTQYLYSFFQTLKSLT
jgi:hypothetical protein